MAPPKASRAAHTAQGSAAHAAPGSHGAEQMCGRSSGHEEEWQQCIGDEYLMVEFEDLLGPRVPAEACARSQPTKIEAVIEGDGDVPPDQPDPSRPATRP